MTPSCSSISYFPSAQTRNSRNGPTATFPEDSIPAHAGKTCLSPSEVRGAWTHPRSRRENHPHAPSVVRIFGSSPLTRGKLESVELVVDADRLIPAHAGKTFQRRSFRGPLAAHPRSRGENTHAACARVVIDGSSPLTRGKRLAAGGSLVCVGLIPAHAGKTGGYVLDYPYGGAHPRSRGENSRGPHPT